MKSTAYMFGVCRLQAVKPVARLTATITALVLSACSITRPTVTQIVPEPPLFMLSAPLTFKPGKKSEQSIIVPLGFVTDLASIPRAMWWWEAPHESTMAPAILHDFLYWEQPCSKDEADAAMYVAMKQVGMPDSGAYSIYLGVRTSISDAAWEKNKLLRNGGESRFFSKAYADRLMSSDVDPNANWSTIRVSADAAPGAFAKHALPVASIREACKAAVIAFNALRGV